MDIKYDLGSRADHNLMAKKSASSIAAFINFLKKMEIIK